MSTHTLSLPRRFARLIRFEHTVFALPFAYVGALLSVDGWPGWEVMAWVTVAMVGARTLAMSLNRLMDAELDARNPRTATRELPAGTLTRGPGVGAVCGRARRLPRGGLLARSDRALAVAHPGCLLRGLSLPEALHVALSPVARRLPRAGSSGRLARRHRDGPVGGVAARCGGGALGGGLRPLLLAVRSRARPDAGLHSWATRFGERGSSAARGCCTR